ncbi:MAG: heavy metal-binding domain-containing protein [Rubrobacter sp.]
MTATGRREARSSWLGRLMARAGARELSAFVVPGPDIARARGVDLPAAGLPVVDTPRHASVLVLVGEVPAGLKNAAAVAYAQMPRPRVILAVGAGDVSPLPEPDVSVSPDRDALAGGVAELRRTFAENAFGSDAVDFDVEAVRSRTEYVCPMHPEVVLDEPGSCPICGMDLVPREAAMGGMDPGPHGAMGHDDPGGERDEPDPVHEGMEHGHMHHGLHADSGNREPADHGEIGHAGMEHEGAAEKRGSHEGMGHSGGRNTAEHEGRSGEQAGVMDRGGTDPGTIDHSGMGHGGMDHGGMDHGDMGFMSMAAMTEGTPRSSDGLQMEWVDAPFGPLFPGLPGGLALTFILDGDTVAKTQLGGGIGGWAPVESLAGPVDGFAGRAARLNPLSPVAYRLLAILAVEDAAGVAPDERTSLARAGALERERAASHLGWLASFGHLLGYAWLEGRAARLQLALLGATDAGRVARLASEARGLRRGVERTPLLRRKLAGLGGLGDGTDVGGPVARAAGKVADARADDEVYRSLGFEPVVLQGDDALSRLRVRLAEIEQSLGLVRRTGSVALPDGAPQVPGSGTGTAAVETPRGAATLRATFEGGEMVGAQLDTPSTRYVALVGAVAGQQEFANALIGVASLDLSPWEVVR